MTQTQTPFQQQSDVTLYQEPDRTSIMAILSMIFGVGGCCLGVTSIPAILLGVFSLVGISRSKGRVGGTGFSIAGILVGLLTLALWAGLFFGGGFMTSKVISQFGTITEQVFVDVQSNDFDSARAAMGSPAADAPDADIIAFREAYRSSLGDFVAKPDGLGEAWSGYGAVIQLFQPYNGRPGYIPIPMRFDSGWALVIYVIDTNGQSQGMPKPLTLIVIDQQGNEFHLPLNSSTAPVPSQVQTPADIPVPELPSDVPEDEAPEGP